MKLEVIFVLVCMLADFGWGKNCYKRCGKCILPTCNFDGKCYYEGESACGLENEKCRRAMKKLPPFKTTESGYCQDDAIKCTY